MGGMADRTTRAVVHALLANAGTRDFVARLPAFEALGPDACDALFAARDIPTELGTHPRDVAEDHWAAFTVAARCWPDRFLELVRDRPLDIVLLSALGEVDRPAARELLVAAIGQRAAGNGSRRRFALESLLRLADPRLPDLLVPLVGDRDSSVRFAAVLAAIDHGDGRLLPRLHRIVDAPRTPPGTREYALDAIEEIGIRDGVQVPPDQRRVVTVPRPGRGPSVVTAVHVWTWTRVGAGDRLATLHNGRLVTAPCAGTVLTIGATVGEAAPPVLFRLTTRH